MPLSLCRSSPLSSQQAEPGIIVGEYGGQVSPQQKSYEIPGAYAAREPRREPIKQRAPGHSSAPCRAILGHRPEIAWTPTTQHVDGDPGGCSPSLQNTPKHVYIISLQRVVLQEHPRPAPVLKEPRERDGGETEGRGRDGGQNN